MLQGLCAQESEVFEITDFTTASDWERSVMIFDKYRYSFTVWTM